MLQSPLKLAYGTARLAVTRPFELVDRIESWQEVKRDGRRYSDGSITLADAAARCQQDAFAAVHDFLGLPDCSTCHEEIRAISGEVSASSPAGHPYDAGEMLSPTLWILVRHLKPLNIVETGVARGVSSAFMLDALDKNGAGHLWSIDLPAIRGDREFTGSAVPDRLRNRWTYILSSSRRALPPLLSELGEIDVFLHDGLHTAETMTMEFHHVWPYLTKNGVLVCDDMQSNTAFIDFARRIDRRPLLMAEAEKGTAIGLIKA
ncbi:class I SAM-dependent methyltransferase [Mycobacterium sp. 94-17]|uniref:class I SAM-dependent methyltransferase n=1 Tax=Mycobacterium sp. 94-17 TaxID=2986147 RepID=UPI002D1F565F|nr:class I SAM-dependent methyltransferase [Mycobacterium sp. 94-17]MEB4210078.1 class I SAM-dependent methyltransferase [Mycobacterium sp. 94-17]